MTDTITVYRRYSIQPLLDQMSKEEADKIVDELQRVWEVSRVYTKRLINSIQGKYPMMSAEQARQAAELLDVPIEEILVGWQDETRRHVKI